MSERTGAPALGTPPPPADDARPRTRDSPPPISPFLTANSPQAIEFDAKSLPEVIHTSRSQETLAVSELSDEKYAKEVAIELNGKEVVEEQAEKEVATAPSERVSPVAVAAEERQGASGQSDKQQTKRHARICGVSRKRRFWWICAISVAVVVIAILAAVLAAVLSGRASSSYGGSIIVANPNPSSSVTTLPTNGWPTTATSSSTPSATSASFPGDCPESHGKDFFAEKGQVFTWDCDVAYSPPYLLLVEDVTITSSRQCIYSCTKDPKCMGIQFKSEPRPECILLSGLTAKASKNGSEVAIRRKSV